MGLDLSALDGALPALTAIAAMASATPLVPIAQPMTAPRAPLSVFDEEDNPRFEAEGPEFEQLVEDVRQRGILQPVLVRLKPSGRLGIHIGRRRFRAACRLQLPELPYVVTEDPRQFDSYAQVAENQERKDLQPLELARFIAARLALGEQKKEVAARLHLDPSAVTHLLALVYDPPPLLLELYHGGRCRSPQYLYALRKLYEQNASCVTLHAEAATVVDRAWLDKVGESMRRAAPLVSEPSSEAGAHVAASAASARQDEGAVAAAGKIQHPWLRGQHQGRALVLLLHRLPSADARIWACYDGEQQAVELPISEIQLIRLSEQPGRRLQLVRTTGAQN